LRCPTKTNRQFVATRWWWVRHAPVRSAADIYGQKDLACDTSDREVFERWRKSAAQRRLVCEQPDAHAPDRDAIWAAGFPKPSAMPHIAALAEQPSR